MYNINPKILIWYAYIYVKLIFWETLSENNNRPNNYFFNIKLNTCTIFLNVEFNTAFDVIEYLSAYNVLVFKFRLLINSCVRTTYYVHIRPGIYVYSKLQEIYNYNNINI